MKIVADENIVAVTEFFGDIGTLLTVPGREITPAMVRDADALLVRSVTPVNATLLQGSKVQYVGTATSGVDHIDHGFLRSRGIAFCDAAGANANSVVEYVFSALAALHGLRGLDWLNSSIGIVGAGNIGGLLARRLDALGFDVAVYDPYLRSADLAAGRLCGFEEVLARDILTLHTPLTRQADYPTWHMFNQEVIDGLRSGQVLINAGRGAVVDNAALLARLQRTNDLHVVLDTWENEPAINLGLLPHVAIGTPHIAGYSLDGKRGGTERIFEGFRRHFGLRELVKAPAQDETFEIDLGGCPHETPRLDLLNHCILGAYDVMADHQELQVIAGVLKPERHFDRLRKQYPARYEFGHYRVRNVPDTDTGAYLETLGFQAQANTTAS